MTDDHAQRIEKELKQVQRLYAAMAAMFIFSCLPYTVAQIVALVLLLYVMPKAYVVRAKAEDESLAWNHATYLIRTFWISSLIFIIGFGLDVFYVMRQFGVTGINTVLDDMMTGMMTGRFVMSDDMRIMLYATFATVGPSLIYFIYRVIKGMSRALKGHRMGDVRGWF